MTAPRAADVVIVGGGVVGAAAAWRLKRDGLAGRVVVIERDPTYARASSFLAMGGIRQQFGSAVCVRMVQHSVELWRDFDQRMRTAAHTPRAWFRPRGYLFLADDATSAALAARADAQDAAGAVQRRLGVDEIAALVPGLMLDDIRWGLFGPEDGYANPREVLFGLRAAAVEAGAEFVTDEVIGVAVAAGRVDGVVLARAGQVSAPVVVNAAGALAGRIAAMAGLDRGRRAGAPAALPVHLAAAVADALSDGRRPGRGPLAPRRSGGRRRARSHHPRLHEMGRTRR